MLGAMLKRGVIVVIVLPDVCVGKSLGDGCVVYSVMHPPPLHPFAVSVLLSHEQPSYVLPP